jgi:hypothetical protein
MSEHETAHASNLVSNEHDSLFAVVALHQGLDEATGVVGDPDGLFRIVRLQHVGPLHLHGDGQEGHRIRIRLIGVAEFHVTGHDWLELR